MVKTRETLDPNRSLWEWMAVDLRFYRLKHAETLARVGQIIGCTRSTVSNLEAARPGFKLADKQAEKLDEHWDLNGHFARLLRYARAGHDPDWFRTFMEYERRARILRLYEALVIPGLPQIPEYATACLRAGRVRDIEAKRRWQTDPGRRGGALLCDTVRPHRGRGTVPGRLPESDHGSDGEPRMSTVNWRKSRRSDTQGNACVEVARLPEGVGVRDSTNSAGPRLALSGRSFADLVHRMKANELDR